MSDGSWLSDSCVDQRMALTLGAHPDQRRLTFRSVAACAYVVRTQPGLIGQGNLDAFFVGTGGDDRVLVIQPCLHFGRSLFIGPLDRLLRSEAPALEEVPHTLRRHRDAVLLLDQLRRCAMAPQRKAYLRLVRRLVSDQPLNRRFLLGTERTPVSGAPAAGDPHRRVAARPVGFHRRNNGALVQFGLRRHVVQFHSAQPQFRRRLLSASIPSNIASVVPTHIQRARRREVSVCYGRVSTWSTLWRGLSSGYVEEALGGLRQS